MALRGGGSGGGWLSGPTGVGLASWQVDRHISKGRAWTDIYMAEGV